MPQLGESVTEGTVTRWLKKEGERVEVDEPLLEVSTDKVDTEIPSPASGILRGIAVDEDETVAVGAQLAVIEDNEGATAGAPAPQASPPAAQTQQAQPPQQTQQPPQQPAAPASSDGWRSPQPNYAPPAPPTAAPAPAPAPVGQAPGYAPPPSYGQQPPQPRSAPEPRETPQEQRTEDHQPSAGDAPYVTPLVRKLAAEHAVALESITGTGVGGRIRKQDVIEAARVQREQAQAAQQAAAAQSAAASQQPAAAAPQSAPSAGQPARQAVAASPLRGTTQRMSRPRQVIAQRMVESLQTSAQLTTVVEADVTAIARLRDRAKRDFEAREGVKLSFLPFFALATVEALKVHPKLNAVIDGDQVTYHDAEHLGIAVDTERGLMVPVIHSAGDLNIGGLARKIADLAQRTRSGQVSPDELSGGTFTLTNTGSRGALFDTPIINQPQVAILGTGTVVKRAVVVEDPSLGEVIAVRSMVYLALTYDHRLVDGADAARFLTTVAARLEEGAFEAELGL
jgi:2-oxoglutarate dehydrogenase E2 component (dihydrolipoamide succinyltransferase)